MGTAAIYEFQTLFPFKINPLEPKTRNRKDDTIYNLLITKKTIPIILGMKKKAVVAGISSNGECAVCLKREAFCYETIVSNF